MYSFALHHKNTFPAFQHSLGLFEGYISSQFHVHPFHHDHFQNPKTAVYDD